MELDELKKSWNALDEQLKKEPIADEKQIAGMIAEYKANARKSIGRLTGWQRFSIGIGVVGLALLLVIWLLPSIFQINEEWQPKINTLVIFVGISILLGIWWDHKNYRWIRNTKIDEMPVAIVSKRMASFRRWTRYEIIAISVWVIVFNVLNYWVTDVCEKQLLPRMLQRFSKHGIIMSRTLHLRGIGESMVASKLDELIMAQTNPTIALYARYGEILIRLTAKAANDKEAVKLLDSMEAKVRKSVDNYIYGVDDATLAACLGQELLKQSKTIAFAESCSGGLASSLVTDVPGSSEYLLGSIVSYTNMAKQKLLNVQADTLAKYGAVSRETACEMALGVRKQLGSDYGVSITGNAGPGASEGKPVGLVYIAVATDNVVYCQEHRFMSTRTENKLRIAQTAISMAIDKLLEEKNNMEDKH